MFEGIPSPCVVTVNAATLASRAPGSWLDAFSLPTEAGGHVPPLLAPVLRLALRAGAEITLLRLCEPDVSTYDAGVALLLFTLN